jgi:hypothetical protein
MTSLKRLEGDCSKEVAGKVLKMLTLRDRRSLG